MSSTYSKRNRNSFGLKLFSGFPALAAFVLGLLIIASSNVQAQILTDSLLNQTIYYAADQVFDVLDTKWKIKVDLDEFNDILRGTEGSKTLFAAGYAKKGMMVRMNFDTLYSDLQDNLSEYREMWWYFYTQDTNSVVAKRRVWEDSAKSGARSWSTSTVLTTHGIEIDEKRFDLFLIKENYWFHAWVTRPVYLEGDSVLMMSILNSIELTAVDSAK